VGGAAEPLGPAGPARALECTPAALGLVAAVAATSVVLARWAEPLFGRYWRQGMWEGGLVEDLTALQFLAGAVIFVLAARAAARRSARRRWLGLYALAMLVLAGEETNYGRGTLLLDLADPNFAASYNPQRGNLHNVLPEAYIPVAGFFVIVALLRVFHRPVVTRLRLPMPRGFLNATLLLLLAAPFMPYADDRFLAVDEVYEWAGALLLLGLACACRWGWFFVSTESGRHP
jgi:hypothetical protein